METLRKNKKVSIKKDEKIKRRMTSTRGITLIALVITVIVLLILAGVTIATLIGDNGILTQANKAKEETEIASEKEQIQLAMTSLNSKKETDIVKRKEKFLQNLENNNVDVYINGNGYTVHYLNSNRIYTIDEKGQVTQESLNILYRDEQPGQLEKITENEETFYQINSIEDLIEWSKNYKTYVSLKLTLGKNLDFKSELSYGDYTTTFYNDFLEVDSDVILMEALTSLKYKGFKSIASYSGTFDGKNFSIKNLYINREDSQVGFIALAKGVFIKNLNIYVDIYHTNTTGESLYTGGIAGYCNGSISNCKVYGTIYSENNSGKVNCFCRWVRRMVSNGRSYN